MKEQELKNQQLNQKRMEEEIQGIIQRGKEEEKKQVVEERREESEEPLNSDDNDSGGVTRRVQRDPNPEYPLGILRQI
jgi:hypothetical protein